MEPQVRPEPMEQPGRLERQEPREPTERQEPRGLMERQVRSELTEQQDLPDRLVPQAPTVLREPALPRLPAGQIREGHRSP
ncbi:hypothetical protein YDYSY3_57340 [Paenibacillus chitinolyticus]|nr:hypothetical protein YDYSY3_57340 [Paenibacillus chitinolyticus]